MQGTGNRERTLERLAKSVIASTLTAANGVLFDECIMVRGRKVQRCDRWTSFVVSFS